MVIKNILLASNLCKFINKKELILLRNMSTEMNDVIVESIRDKGILTLNRPKALNALDLSMVKKILPTLIKWEQEKSLVIVKGAGEKSFCAGGDVKSIALAGQRGDPLGNVFFKHEYTMNGIIGTYKIPYVAFIDGIVMGGGVGLSVHGQYRVATERSLFAMPETQIGLFPDVGGSYFLPRLGGKLGLYLGLTGQRLKGYDMLKAGIATHYVNSASLPDLEKQLLDCCNAHDIDKVLKKFSVDGCADFSLAPYLKQINKCFSAPTVEAIVKELEKDNSQWAQSTIKMLCKMSPTSMKVTKVLLERGAQISLHECLQMEYNVAVNTLAKNDFYEGVRALLIDKDQSPKWKPATLEDVSDDLVESHFVQVSEGLTQEFRNKL
ncbi:3-hydroxyisobutyryl-CoA hydrolase [Carabus blaptoides fortunei]